MDNEFALSVPVVVGLGVGSVVAASVLFSVVVGVDRVRRHFESAEKKAIRAHFAAARAQQRITGFAPLPSTKPAAPRVRVSCAPAAGSKIPVTVDVEVNLKSGKVREL